MTQTQAIEQATAIIQAAQHLLTPDHGDDGELTTNPELIFDVLSGALTLLSLAGDGKH